MKTSFLKSKVFNILSVILLVVIIALLAYNCYLLKNDDYEDFTCYYETPNYYHYRAVGENDKDFVDYYKNVRTSSDGLYDVTDYEDGVCIREYLGEEKNVIIPETIDGKKVVKIGISYYSTEFSEDETAPEYINYETAFEAQWNDVDAYNSFIESIYIPRYVREIDSYTFRTAGEKLKKIEVAPENEYFKSSRGMLFSATGVLLWDYSISFDISYCDTDRIG